MLKIKISKSKRQLAQLLIEAGVRQLPKGANWSAQDRNATVTYFNDEPWRCYDHWECSRFKAVKCLKVDGKALPNWHQCILSRAEFDHIVAETAPDADGWIEWSGGECPVDRGALIDVKFRDGTVQIGCEAKEERSGTHKYWTYVWSHSEHASDIIAYRLHKPEQPDPVWSGVDMSKDGDSTATLTLEPTTTPTLDQLLRDWCNADDFAQRKQTEADEAAAMRDERWQAVQARVGEMGVTVGRCETAAEPELVITDYHQLRIGGVLRCTSLPCGARCKVGDEGVLVKTENHPVTCGVYVDVHGVDWFGVFGEHWEFIRRP